MLHVFSFCMYLGIYGREEWTVRTVEEDCAMVNDQMTNGPQEGNHVRRAEPTRTESVWGTGGDGGWGRGGENIWYTVEEGIHSEKVERANIELVKRKYDCEVAFKYSEGLTTELKEKELDLAIWIQRSELRKLDNLNEDKQLEKARFDAGGY
jgi:hypothetical protein